MVVSRDQESSPDICEQITLSRTSCGIRFGHFDQARWQSRVEMVFPERGLVAQTEAAEQLIGRCQRAEVGDPWD